MLLALLCAVGLQVYLFHTVGGFKLRLTGANKDAARASRIDSSKALLSAFTLSGALCGLAGGVEFAGTAGLIGNGFNQGWGFLGIPVALLAGLSPIGCIASALYFGALLAGSENLGRFTQGGPTLVSVVQAVAVLGFVAFASLRTMPRVKSLRTAWMR